MVSKFTVSESTTIFGLSTDVKPTTGVLNGSVFIEMDTGKAYFYDAYNEQWLEV